jgi:hypothetical protein
VNTAGDCKEQPAVTGKFTLLDVVPLDATVIVAVPTAAIKAAGTEAVSWPPLTNTVDNPEPFHCTDAPETNPLPLAVSVKAGPPTAAPVGFREVTTGVGLFMGKFTVLEVAPPDDTVIAALPTAAMRGAGTEAVS